MAATKTRCVVRVKNVKPPHGKTGNYKELKIYSKVDKITIGPLSPEDIGRLLSDNPPEDLVVEFDYQERKKKKPVK